MPQLNVEISSNMKNETMSDRRPSVNGTQCVPLGLARRGFRGHIHAIHVGNGTHGLAATELERRLLAEIDEKEDNLRVYRLTEPVEIHVKQFGAFKSVDFEGPLVA